MQLPPKQPWRLVDWDMKSHIAKKLLTPSSMKAHKSVGRARVALAGKIGWVSEELLELLHETPDVLQKDVAAPLLSNTFVAPGNTARSATRKREVF